MLVLNQLLQSVQCSVNVREITLFSRKSSTKKITGGEGVDQWT